MQSKTLCVPMQKNEKNKPDKPDQSNVRSSFTMTNPHGYIKDTMSNFNQIDQ